jgi:D-glycero-D-manno-heptose 1,7-bisphosphate phosphatase
VHPGDVRLAQGAGAAVRSLNDARIPVVVVTNQRGVATGDITADEVARVDAVLAEQLAAHEAHVDGWYVCQHAVGECRCRKPLPGLLESAFADHPDAVPARSVVVGDAETDVLAGCALGVPGILIASARPDDTAAIMVATSLAAAIAWLLPPASR